MSINTIIGILFGLIFIVLCLLQWQVIELFKRSHEDYDMVDRAKFRITMLELITLPEDYISKDPDPYYGSYNKYAVDMFNTVIEKEKNGNSSDSVQS